MADTINTGAMLIKEGALLPESLRFESEPWTFFYRAGEIVRELRKAPVVARQCATVDAEETPNARNNRNGDDPDQGRHTVARSPALRK